MNKPGIPVENAGATNILTPLSVSQTPLSPVMKYHQSTGVIGLGSGQLRNTQITVSGAANSDVSPPSLDETIATVTDVAKYFLALAREDGDLITNLKMQKLVYYAYAHVLINNGRRLFKEPIEAWPNGPVVSNLYRQLKRYGASPIGEDFSRIESEAEFDALVARFPEDVLETLNGVYETYMPMSAFQLVTSTHGEKPWREARRGLSPTDHSENILADEDFIEQFTTP